MTAKSIDTTTYQLSFPQLNREIPCRADETLFQSARRHGVRIVGACGGRGACGSCMVQVTEGETDNSENSTALISSEKKWKQACNLHPRSDCTLEGCS